MKYLVKYILLYFLLSLVQLGHAQDWKLILEMVVTEGGNPISGATVNLYKNGSFVEKAYSDGDGRVDLKLSPNQIYRVDVGGSDNYIKKKLLINTNDVPTEAITQDTYFPAEVDIFKKLEGLDYKVLDQPIGKIAYDTNTENFEVDREYTAKRQSKLKELEDQYLAQKAKLESQYKDAVKAADKAFKKENWQEAKKNYEEAAKLKPSETYPSFQLAELKTKMIEINKNDEQYQKSIENADQALEAKDYKTAIAAYKRAIKFKPNEAYPQDKIDEVKDLLAKEAKLDQDYLTAIEEGDNALKVKELETAKVAFEKATKLKPNESYPQNKLSEINDILAKREAKEKEYQNAIANGDQAIENKDYEKAKASYEKAKELKPTESYPTEQLAEVEKLMVEAEKREQNYLAAVETGENALQENNYQAAIEAFKEAQAIKPSEEYPKNKIKEVEDFIAKKEAKNKAYAEKIAEADEAFKNDAFETAQTAYQAAAEIKPKESYPLDQLAKVETALQAIAQKEEKYGAAIKKGDEALAAEDYQAAKAAYQEALNLKSAEQYPKEKLSEIETIVLKIEQNQAAYDKAISDADEALEEKDYEAAKKAYNEAITLKEEAQYPKDKIAEIEETLAALKEEEAAYAAAIEKGDQAKGVDNLKEAKAAYEEALAVKSDASYPQKQIAEIEQELQNREVAKAAYQAAVEKGDEALSSKSYEKALTAFKEALALKENESYPKEKIAEIEQLIADKEAETAQYQAAIDAGDAAFEKEKWEEAKQSYEAALAIKAEDYPKTKLSEVEEELTAIAEAEKAAAKRDADYQKAITEGDTKLKEKDLEAALAAFQEAKKLKPEESYPNEKIAAIEAEQEKIAAEKAEEKRLAEIEEKYQALITSADASMDAENFEAARKDYQAALALKEEEAYPKEKIEKINGILKDAKAQEKAYQEAIAAGDKLFSEEQWKAAKEQFAEASAINSEEAYPKDKIAVIDEKLAAIAAKEKEIKLQNEKEAAREEEYQELLAAADQSFESEDFEAAKSEYEAALAVKEETYPKEQLSLIDEKLAAIEAAKEAKAEAAAAAKVDAEYQKTIVEADQLLEEKQYQKAKGKYQAALNIKEGEAYAQGKIDEIDEQLALIAAKKEEEQKAAEKAAREEKFQAFITAGDQLMEEQKLEAAKEEYISAISIKEDPYPAQKIAEIDDKLAARSKAKAAAEKQAQIDEAYQAAINTADQALENENYQKAAQNYQAALDLKANETYPAEKLDAVNALIEQEEKAAAKKDAKYQEKIAIADRALSEKDYEGAKQTYQEALLIKSKEDYPQTKIDEIENLLTEKAQKEEEIRLQEAQAAQKEADYEKAITKADQLFSDKELEKALDKYEAAKTLMPSKAYPQEQIDRINDLLEKRQLAKAEAKRKKEAKAAAAERYQALITSGDEAIANNQYRLAKREYQAALEIRPEESYPKEQLQKVKATIAQQKEKELAEKKNKEDEPIEIQTGPRSTIDKSTESEIDEMYEEIWSKRQAEKKEEIKTKEETLKAMRDKRKEKEHQKRKAAHERIEGIAISLEKQKENEDALNMQNYETVKEKEEALQKTREKRSREADKKRKNAFAENEEYREALAENREQQKEKQKDQNAQLENIQEQVAERERNRRKAQKERIGNSKTKVEKKAEAIREYSQERSKNNLQANTAQLAEMEQNREENLEKYNAASRQRIEANNDAINAKRKAIHDFNKDNANTYDKAQSALETRVKNYKEFENQHRKESKARIKRQQEQNEAILRAEEERAQKRGQGYKEGQQSVAEKEAALEKRQDALNAAAKKRREEQATEEYYRGEAKKREDREAADYPQGVTEKVIEGENSTTIRRIVVDDTQVDIYEKTLYNYGEVYYSKNGRSITEEVWDKESIE